MAKFNIPGAQPRVPVEDLAARVPGAEPVTKPRILENLESLGLLDEQEGQVQADLQETLALADQEQDPDILGAYAEQASDLAKQQEQIDLERDAYAEDVIQEAKAQEEEQARQRILPLANRIQQDQRFEDIGRDAFDAQLDRAKGFQNVLTYDPEGARPHIQGYLAPNQQRAVEAGLDPFRPEPGVIKSPLGPLTDTASFDAAIFEDGQMNVDPVFSTVSSLLTEKYFSGSEGVVDGAEFEPDFDENEGDVTEELGPELSQTKAQGNERLGRQIYQEYMREKAAREGLPSDEYIVNKPEPDKADMEYVGAMAKEAYAIANPDMVKRVVGPDKQVRFTPTQMGLQAFRKADAQAGQPFDGIEVKPGVAPSPKLGAQPAYEAKTLVRDKTKAIKAQPKGKNLEVMNEARENMNKIGFMVDGRAEGITYQNGINGVNEGISYWQRANGFVEQTIEQNPEAEYWKTENLPDSGFFSNLYGIGSDKLSSLFGKKLQLQITAELKAQEALEAEGAGDWNANILREQANAAQEEFLAFSPMNIYRNEINKAAESLNTVARYSDQMSHLTYSIQMGTGRMNVQQNKFNPQNNKIVRFASRIADRPVTVDPNKNSQIEQNFKEVMAVYFLTDTAKRAGIETKPKNLHIKDRIELFNRTAQAGGLAPFIQMGKELRKQQLTPDQVNAAKAELLKISAKDRDGQKIINIPPGLQQVSAPTYSNALIAELKKHDAEEQPYIMEALMDLSRWAEGKPFDTRLEPEMDGITHGISSNGAALGIENTMLRGGIIHIGDIKQMVKEPQAKATTPIPGVTMHPDGLIEIEVTPDILSDLTQGAQNEQQEARLQQQIVEYVLAKSGLGKASPGQYDAYDYTDDAGNKIDVKLMKPEEYRNGNVFSVWNTLMPKWQQNPDSVDYLEFWEAVDYPIRPGDVGKTALGNLKPGMKISVRPMKRVAIKDVIDQAVPTGYTSGYTHRLDLDGVQGEPPVQLFEDEAIGDLRVQMAAQMAVDGPALADKRGGDQAANFAAIAELAAGDRPNYLKKAPMTFIYGQELRNLTHAVKDTMYTGKNAKKIQRIIKDNQLNPGQVESFLHELLVETLINTLTPEAIAVSRQLRANNVLAILSGELMYYDNAMGFRNWIGGTEPAPEQTTRSELKFRQGGKTQSSPVYHYKSTPHGAATRPGYGVGGYGHGRIIPGVVQAYDGNMIARTFSGKGWDKIQHHARSRGYAPGAMPIFDATKTNLANFDTVREVMNEEWWEGIESTSFVENIMGKDGWFRQTMDKTLKELANRNAPVPLDEGQFIGLHEFMADAKLRKYLIGAIYPVQSTAELLGSDKKFVDTVNEKLEGLVQAYENKIEYRDGTPFMEPKDVASLIREIVMVLKIPQTNAALSQKIADNRRKAFAKVNKNTITQVDIG